MVLSLSPGETPLAMGAHVAAHANMWRISDDFWDNWNELRKQFERLRNWVPFAGPGHYPDADMLPLGKIRFGKDTRFTRDEQVTLMTLWSIARSPLIHGGDLTQTDDFTFSLLTNPEVIAVNQDSFGNHELFHRDNLIAWIADAPGSTGKYVALFNIGDIRSEAVRVEFKDLGFKDGVRVRNLWQRADLPLTAKEFSPVLPPHGAALFRLTPIHSPAND
jgi:hypothetical protein